MGDMYTNPPQSRNEAILRATIDGTEYTDPPQSRIEDLLIELKQTIESGSVSSYNDLTDKPSINDVTLSGNKTSDDLHILQGNVPYLLSDVSNVSIVADGTTITIAWTDPNDIMDGSTVVTAWAGTKVVRKAGSAPENVFDGTVVVDSKTKNQYASSGYADANLAEGIYYYRFFPYSENGVYTQGQYGSGTARIPNVYGVEWDGSSSPALTRTDLATNFVDPNPYYSGMSGTPSSPFDEIMPWAGMEIVEDANAGTLVKIPKFYYKITRTGDAIKFQISPDHETGFKCSPAHMDRGDGQGERDYIYVGRYHSFQDNAKSETGKTPSGSYSYAGKYNQVAHELGSDIWLWDFAVVWTIRMLYIVEFANWDTKLKIGNGHSPSGNTFQMGYTDNMGYHTGTTATSRSSNGGTQYRYIEGLWDNVFDEVGGFAAVVDDNSTGSDMYICKNPNDHNDFSKYESVGYKITSSVNGCLKSLSEPTVSEFDWAMYPKTGTGTSNYTVYMCDSVYEVNYKMTFSGDGKTLMTGSNSSISSSNYKGLFGNQRPNGPWNGSTGFRLMKLPNNS